MKLPPKFAVVLLPVTLIHIVAITLFGVMMRMQESKHSEEKESHFVANQMGAPGEVDPALFPESQIPLENIGETVAPSADPEPMVLEEEGPPPKKEKRQVPVDTKAQRRSAEPAPKVRGFKPIGVKKPT